MTQVRSESLVIMGAFDGIRPTPAEDVFFSQTPLGGYIFFKRNISHDYEKSLPPLIASIQNKYGQVGALGPLLMGVDQEGGRVSRLGPPCPNLGPPQSIEEGDISSATLKTFTDYGYKLGSFLKKLGFNLNFAPVVDILSQEQNTCIGDRSFGVTPEQVTLRAGSFLSGLQNAGILGCLKHFPGQGDASTDTHVSTAIVETTREILESRELIPYQKLLSKAQTVMIAHCIYTQLDSVPASLSKIIIRDLLIKHLGFKGLIISDDMIMGAVPQEDDATWGEALCQAIAAGIDLLIISKDIQRMKFAISTLSQEAKKSPAFSKRLKEAAEKVVHIRRNISGKVQLHSH